MNFQCCHNNLSDPQGLALITVGNELRGDDGIAAVVCNTLPKNVLENVCRFDLSLYTNFIGDCLKRHKAAIVLDATSNGDPPGTVNIIDLAKTNCNKDTISVRSCHGFSLMDEIRLASKHFDLPKFLIFFGIEINGTNWPNKISPPLEHKLPELKEQLLSLIIELQKRPEINA